VPFPILHLFGGVIELDKGPHSRWPPAGQRGEESSEIHDALGPAAEPWIAVQAALGVRELDGIDVDGHDFVMRS
jgi:hypothetical protein